MMHGAAGRLAAACAVVLSWTAATADTRIFLGGSIHTGSDAAPRAEAVVVTGGRIVFTGAIAAARQAAGPRADVVDLKGGALFPGFTDSHMHLLGVGQRELTLNLDATASIADLKARVAAEAAKTAKGQVIYGRGWIETHWPDGRFPTRADLDEAAPDHPVILVRADGHALVANSPALKRAGISAATPDPQGGRIERDSTGAPTGMLIDKAMALVLNLIDAPSREARTLALETAGKLYVARGWTSVHNMSVDPANLPVIEELAAAGKLKLRVYNALKPEGAALLADGPRVAAGGRVVTRALKFYADGALGSRGAALLAPYDDAPGHSGLLRTSEAEIMPVLKRALRRGIQISTHAIGDRANRLVLDWYEKAFAAVPPGERAPADPRWRVEHAQVIARSDIPRFAELGVIASMQPSHAIGDLHFAPARLGQDRLKSAYAWMSLVKSGAMIAGGSDAPVEAGSPGIEFYAAVARRDLKGFSGPGWHEEEALDRATALKLFTIWAAHAAFQDTELGTIEPGKRADFTVLSADIMTIPESEIPKVRALMTVIGGEIVHRE